MPWHFADRRSRRFLERWTSHRQDYESGGDRVTIAFTADLCLKGTIVWLVWHKAGICFSAPLSEADPVFRYLTERAEEIERHHARAVAVLAQSAIIARRSDNA
jgi:hypothetical protein